MWYLLEKGKTLWSDLKIMTDVFEARCERVCVCVFCVHISTHTCFRGMY